MPKIWTVWPHVHWSFWVTFSSPWVIQGKLWIWWPQPCNWPPRSQMSTCNCGHLQYSKTFTDPLAMYIESKKESKCTPISHKCYLKITLGPQSYLSTTLFSGQMDLFPNCRHRNSLRWHNSRIRKLRLRGSIIRKDCYKFISHGEQRENQFSYNFHVNPDLKS